MKCTIRPCYGGVGEGQWLSILIYMFSADLECGRAPKAMESSSTVVAPRHYFIFSEYMVSIQEVFAEWNFNRKAILFK